MLELVSRKSAFEQFPYLAYHVLEWQKAVYNPSDSFLNEGEEVFLEVDDDVPTVLTKKQAEKLNVEYSAECLELCDDFVQPPSEFKFYKSIIGELETATFTDFTERIGKSLSNLSVELGWENIVLISNSRTPYLAQDNSYKPVKEAVRTLTKMGIRKTTSEAIKVSEETIEDLFAAIFWIVRCNASSPGICFSSASSKTVGTLCKYGNIHFDCYDRSEAIKIQQAFLIAGFKEAANGVCIEKYSDQNAISGREIVL